MVARQLTSRREMTPDAPHPSGMTEVLEYEGARQEVCVMRRRWM